MGLFTRLRRNIFRAVEDVAPIVQVVAPIVAPGVGGFIASRIAGAVGRRVERSNAPQRSTATAIRAGAPVIRPVCRRLGTLGGGFSAPFQARNFISGGSFPGRSVATFGGRVPVGRDIRARFCPDPTPALPKVNAELLPTKAPVSTVAPATIQIRSATDRFRLGFR